jgi:hypothetical protein
MQLALNRRFPRPSIRYRRSVRIAVSSPRLFVRVRDRAGNWSHWQRVARG